MTGFPDNLRAVEGDLHGRFLVEQRDGWLCDAGMTYLTDMSALHATERLVDWLTAVRAENKSPGPWPFTPTERPVTCAGALTVTPCR